MSVEEKVVIKVEIDSDITNDLISIERRIKALETRQAAFNKQASQGNAISTKTSKLTQQLNKDNDNGNKIASRTSRIQDKLSKAFSGVAGGLMKAGKALSGFLMTLSKFSFIGVAAGVALFTAGLLAVKAALITGRLAVQAYQGALRGLSAVAAGVATAIAVAAAAIREFQEAQLSPFFGGGAAGLSSARQANRAISAQTRGLLGGEAASAVVGSFGRAGISGGNQVASQLFNLTGGDAKAVQSLAASFATAKQSGNTDELLKALQGAAGYQADSLTAGMSLSAITSAVAGGAVTTDAFKGVATDMANTFIGTLKTELETFKNIFATIGEPLLGTFKESFLQISSIIKDDLLGFSGALQKFGAASFAPTLVSIADALSEFVRSNIVSHIEDISTMGDSLLSIFTGVRDFFRGIGAYLKELEPAADVIVDMFRAMGNAMSGNGLFQSFANMVVSFSEPLITLGAAIGNVIDSLLKAYGSGQSGFFAGLDRLATALNVVAGVVVPMLADIMQGFVPLLDQIPGLIADFTRGFGPIIIQILEEMKPIFDKLPEIMDGVLMVVTALAPIVMTLIRALDMALGALGAVPGGGYVTGALALGGYALLGTKGGRGLLKSKGGGLLKGAGAVAAGSAGGGRMFSGKVGTGGLASRAGARVSMLGTGKFGQSALGQYLGGASKGSGMMTGSKFLSGATSRAFGGLSAFQIGRDMFRAGSPGAFLKSANQENIEDPLGQGVKYGSAASLVPIPGLGMVIGGGLAGVGAARNINKYGANVGNVATSIGGFAAVGAGLGAMATPFGSAVGAAAGAALGAAVAGLSAYNRDKRITKHAKEAGKSLMEAISESAIDGISEAEFTQQSELSELVTAALDASWTTKGYTEGDTRQMDDLLNYLSATGQLVDASGNAIDAFDIHRDKFLQEQLPGILEASSQNIERYMLEQERIAKEHQVTLTRNLDMLANQLDTTTDAVSEFARTIGVDLGNAFNAPGFRALFDLARYGPMDLMQAFSPDVSKTAAYGIQSTAGANAALNALIGSAQSGVFDPAELESFFDQYSSAEIALGGTPALSGLSAIQELERQLSVGAFGGAAAPFMQMFDLDLMRRSIISELSQTYGVSESNISGVLDQGGVDAANVYLENLSGIRRIATSGLLGSGEDQIDSFVKLQESIGTNIFSDPKIMEMISSSLNPQQARLFGNLSTAEQAAFVQQNYKGGEDVEGGGLTGLMSQWLTTSGTASDKQIGLLTEIRDAVEGYDPTVVIGYQTATGRGGDELLNLTVRSGGGRSPAI